MYVYQNFISPAYAQAALELRDDGLLYWRSDRPESHFTAPPSHKHFVSLFGGRLVTTKPRQTGKNPGPYYLPSIGLTGPDHVRRQIPYTHLVWALCKGVWPRGDCVVSFINGIATDGREGNLIEVSRLRLFDNCDRGRELPQGVKERVPGSYQARINNQHLGTFATAALARFVVEWTKKAREDAAGIRVLDKRA